MMEIKKITVWKTLAIVFFIIALVEFLFLAWAWSLAIQEEENYYDCLWDICADEPYADYIDGVCTCYDLDTLGQYIITDQEYLR